MYEKVKITKTQLLDLLAKHYTAREMADRFQCHPKTIFEKLRKFDLHLPKKIIPTKSILQELFIRQSWTCSQIAKHLNTTQGRIESYLQKYKVVDQESKHILEPQPLQSTGGKKLFLIPVDTTFYGTNGQLLSFDDIKNWLKKGSPIEVFGYNQDFHIRPVTILSIQKAGLRSVQVVENSKKRIFTCPEIDTPIFVFNGAEIELKPLNALEDRDQILFPRQLPGPIQPSVDIQVVQEAYLPDTAYPVRTDEFNQTLNQAIKLIRLKYNWKNVPKKLGFDIDYYYYTSRDRINTPSLGRLKTIAQHSELNFKSKYYRPKTYSKKYNNYILPDTLTPEFAEILGLLLSDGMIVDSINLFNSDLAIHQRYSILTEKVFNLEPKLVQYEYQVDYSLIHNYGVEQFLISLGFPDGKKVRKSTNCFIPNIIMQASNEILLHFLNGYITGDGYMGDFDISIGTASKQMARDLVYIFQRLGHYPSWRSKFSIKYKSTSYEIVLSSLGTKILGEQIVNESGFPYPRTQTLLSWSEDYIPKRSIDSIILKRYIVEKVWYSNKFIN